MTDLWDEKPHKRGGAMMGDNFEWRDHYYDPEEMDAWLAKLKAHYAPIEEKADAMLRFRKAAEDLGEYAADLKDKLDAVRNKVTEWDSTHMRDRHAAPSILMDLEKILGAEG